MKKNNKKMHPKELPCGLISKLIFGLFIELFNQYKESDDLLKRNRFKKGAGFLYNASVIEDKIKKIWGQEQDLLSGLLIYIHFCDEYFNPNSNAEDLFFRKIFTFNRDLLVKIGKGIIKPSFPFVNFDNHKKKKNIN